MANDVNLSMIYLGNFADIDTYEGNLATENETDLLGTYGSPGDPLFNYVTTVDSDSPTQFVDADHDTGNGTLTYDTGTGQVTVGLDSFVTYNGTVQYADGSSETLVVDIFQMTNGDVFIPAYDNYTQFGTKAIESVTLNSVDYDRWGGFQQSSYDSVQFVCLASGTHIRTPHSDLPVEMLKAGDLVTTLDNGPRPIVWIGRRTLRFPPSPDRQKPVLFQPGSLGSGVPERPLTVSPQHRLLVHFSSRCCGALAPAVSFLDQPGVRRKTGCKRVTYIALLFSRHQIVFAEGAPVESFYPAQAGLRTLTPFERLQLTAFAPRSSFGPPARPLISSARARGMMKGRALITAP